jgi:hypothetical protein
LQAEVAADPVEFPAGAGAIELQKNFLHR